MVENRNILQACKTVATSPKKARNSLIYEASTTPSNNNF
jgi:hypothetical protein